MSDIVLNDAAYAEISSLTCPAEHAILCGLRPYDWQWDILRALGKNGSDVLLRTCNESGKTSFIGAHAVRWHMETFMNSLTITTSASYNQIINQLYPSLKSMVRGKKGWKIMKDHGIYEPTGSRLVSFSTDDAGRAEGWHEPPLMSRFGDATDANPLKAWDIPDEMWGKVLEKQTSSLLIFVDEAKSVEPFVIEALERCHPTRRLIASTPGASEGPFWDFWHRELSRFTYSRHVSWEDCPHLENSKRHMREKHYQEQTKPEWLIRSMWYGEFADIVDKGVFNMGSLDRAMSGTLPIWGRGQKRAAFDPSGGGDECPLYFRDGNDCRLIKVWRERDDELLATELIIEFKRLGLQPENIFADDGGLGKMILNNLERKGWPVNRILFGGKARDAKCYADVRAEMYCELANHINKEEIRLQFDTELREQFGWHKRVSNENPIRLVKKDKFPHSPDRADTIAMLYYDMPDAVEYKDRRNQIQRALSATMHEKSMFDHEEDEQYASPLNW